MKNFLIYTSIIGTILTVFSCEKEREGIVDQNFRAPFLFEAHMNISHLDLDTSANVTPLENMTYRLTLEIGSSAIRNGSDSPSHWTLRLYKPNVPSSFVKFEFSAETAITDTISFSSPISFIVQRSDVGLLKFEFSLQTTSGQVSNIIQKSLLITRRNSIPILSHLVAPDTIIRPLSGFTLLLFAMTINDPDGYNDIKETFFKRIFPTESVIVQMYDDGNIQNNGDNLAGDGIFSRLVRIDSTALLGDEVFLFQAKDNTNAYSDSLLHTITIVP